MDEEHPTEADDEWIPEPDCYRELHVQADYAYCYLWDMNGVSFGCETIGGGDDLDRRFLKWAEKHELVFDRQIEKRDWSQYHVPDAYLDGLEQEGELLCQELAKVCSRTTRLIRFGPLGRRKREIVVGPLAGAGG